MQVSLLNCSGKTSIAPKAYVARDSHMLRLDHHIIPTLHLLPSRQVDRIVLHDLLDQCLRDACVCGEGAAEEEMGRRESGGGSKRAEEGEGHF